MDEKSISKTFINWSDEQQCAFVEEKLNILFDGMNLNFESIEKDKDNDDSKRVSFKYLSDDNEGIIVSYLYSKSQLGMSPNFMGLTNSCMGVTMTDELFKRNILYKRHTSVRKKLFETIADYKLEAGFLQTLKYSRTRHLSDEELMSKVMNGYRPILLGLDDDTIICKYNLCFCLTNIYLKISMDEDDFMSLYYDNGKEFINDKGHVDKICEDKTLNTNDPRQVFEECFYDLYLKEHYKMNDMSAESLKIVQMIVY